MFFDNYKYRVKTTIIKSRTKFSVKLQSVYARMTWLGKAMKDGVSTDMPRGAANWL